MSYGIIILGIAFILVIVILVVVLIAVIVSKGSKDREGNKDAMTSRAYGDAQLHMTEQLRNGMGVSGSSGDKNFCSKCGASLSVDDVFCKNCGNRV